MPINDRDAEWESLYNALVALLARWGRDQAVPDPGDYLVVDDDWGGWSQKICFVNPNLPIDDISRSIQELLSARHPRWDVILVFDDGTSRESLRVYRDKIDLLTEVKEPNTH